MPGGLGNEGDSMSTQNSRHSHQSVSSSTPTLPSGSTPVPAAFEEARLGSAISIQSFHSFQPSPRGSHQHNAATPHQLGQYHASPEPGHGAMQARQLARYSPADGQQSAQYSPAHGQQSAQYSPAHGQQSTAYDVQAQQSALYSPAHGQQSTAYDVQAQQSALYSPAHGQQSTAYNVQARQSALYSPAHGQQSTAYDMQAQQSTLYSPAHGQQSTAYDVQAQQSMVYDMQAQQGGGHSPAHGQQSALYNPAHGQQSALYSPAHGQQSTAYDVQAQQSMMYDSWNVWGQRGIIRAGAAEHGVQPGGRHLGAAGRGLWAAGRGSNPTANEFPPRIDLRNPPASRKRRIEIEENLVASRRALRDIAETTNGQTGMYDALRVSHEQAMDELRRAGVDALKHSESRHLEDTVAKLRGEYANDLGQERAQNEVRFAAVALVKFVPNRLLKEARQELDKHPGVVVIPRQTPDDGDDESEEETFDEAQKQQAVSKRKKRNKEPESDDEGGIAKDLERARKSQQENGSQRFGKALESGPQKTPSITNQLGWGSRSAQGRFGALLRKGIHELHPQPALDRQTGDETLATVAREGFFQSFIGSRQARADETKNDAKQRAEEWEEERCLKTNRPHERQEAGKRMATAKRMKKIRLQEGQPEPPRFSKTRATFKALGTMECLRRRKGYEHRDKKCERKKRWCLL
ncbi:hypothetical protein B0H13DRAFT_1914101 [Mycena leptocephala]|nr:hypothetical protein B0H13DRAFT_1914101 [Mycena leptocephala]